MKSPLRLPSFCMHCLCEALDVVPELLGGTRHLREVRRDLLRGGRLLLTDGARRLDGMRDVLDRTVHLRQCHLDALCRLTRLLGELAHLLGNNGKAASLLARTCRLDGCVQAEQIRLSCDVRDEVDDLDRVGVALLEEFRLLDGLLPCLCELRCALGDLLDRLKDSRPSPLRPYFLSLLLPYLFLPDPPRGSCSLSLSLNLFHRDKKIPSHDKDFFAVIRARG